MLISICQANYLKLSEMRNNKGYSQQQLADLIGVRRSTISDWENGKMLPTPENIDKLANVLEVDFDVLEALIKARYYAKQLKLLGCSVEDYEYLYDQVA